MSGTVTCEQCLRGRSTRCIGPNCAQWKETWKPAQRTKRGEQAKRKQSGRKNRGRFGARIRPDLAHAIALDLLHTTIAKPAIARRHGVTFEQVRTVQRNLGQLSGEKIHRDYVPPLDERISKLEAQLEELRAQQKGRAT